VGGLCCQFWVSEDDMVWRGPSLGAEKVSGASPAVRTAVGSHPQRHESTKAQAFALAMMEEASVLPPKPPSLSQRRAASTGDWRCDWRREDNVPQQQLPS
jgi:hypothetical protein